MFANKTIEELERIRKRYNLSTFDETIAFILGSFNKGLELALSFDDVTLKPSYADFLPSEADVKTRITKELIQNNPLISAAMDTITESRMAIAMAQSGGSGAIHRNLSIADQAKEVAKVKRDWNLVIEDPFTISPEQSLREVKRNMQAHRISGLPVLENGLLVGIITQKDTKRYEDLDTKVAQMMTKKDVLVHIEWNENFSQEDYFGHAEPLMKQHSVDKILVIRKENDNYLLKGLITSQDVKKRRLYRNACLINGKLICGAAIGCKLEGKENDIERAEALIKAGVDYVVVDSSHGHSKGVIETVKALKHYFGKIQVIGGNVCTGEGAEDLIKAGTDGLKVGIGPGSTCITRKQTGAGIPQITSIKAAALVADRYRVPVTADGGIDRPGYVTKAIAAGASAVMVGTHFGGTNEAPGEVVDGCKIVRGMGSLEAMLRGSADRYKDTGVEDFGIKDTVMDLPLAQGISMKVPCKGPVYKLIDEMVKGLKYGLGLTGKRTIEDLRKSDFYEIFMRVTIGGAHEGACEK